MYNVPYKQLIIEWTVQRRIGDDLGGWINVDLMDLAWDWINVGLDESRIMFNVG